MDWDKINEKYKLKANQLHLLSQINLNLFELSFCLLNFPLTLLSTPSVTIASPTSTATLASDHDKMDFDAVIQEAIRYYWNDVISIECNSELIN